MKILYITTIGTTMGFFTSYIKDLLDAGHTVDIATNETASPVRECYSQWGCRIFPISTSRSPFSGGNILAVGQIKKIVEGGNYDIVHCHTPIAAACARLACRSLRKKGVNVIYTAHGFHFYSGAPKLNWLIFYPVEKLCGRWTDTLITINQEDFQRATATIPAKKVEYIPGVGIDVAKFADTQIDRATKLSSLGIPENAFVLCSVGELNANKNHEVVIRAMALLEQSNVHYMVAGIGDRKDYLLSLARELHLEERVHLLGYRKDVAELYKVSDLFLFPSFREGLPVSVMEAMAAGKPVICSNIRGNADLVQDGKGGYIITGQTPQLYAEKIGALLQDPQTCTQMGLFNRDFVKAFGYENVRRQLERIYFP